MREYDEILAQLYYAVLYIWLSFFSQQPSKLIDIISSVNRAHLKYQYIFSSLVANAEAFSANSYVYAIYLAN